MSAHGYIRVVNWEKFQHGTKHDLPWFKVYSSLLGNDEWLSLSTPDRCLLMCIWMLTNRYGNGRVRADERWLKGQAKAHKSSLVRLNDAGFIEFQPTKSVALTRARLEGEGSKEPKTETRASADAADGGTTPPPEEPSEPWADAPDGLAQLATVFARGDVAA